jgi:hypothetical protein
MSQVIGYIIINFTVRAHCNVIRHFNLNYCWAVGHVMDGNEA